MSQLAVIDEVAEPQELQQPHTHNTDNSQPTHMITLGVELEFLVPDDEPQYPEDDDALPTDYYLSDLRWFLTRAAIDKIDKNFPDNLLQPNCCHVEYAYFYIAHVLRSMARVPALTTRTAVDYANAKEQLARCLERLDRDFAHRERSPRGAVVDDHHYAWNVGPDSTVFVSHDHKLCTLYGWNSIELISPVFTSLSAFRADVDVVCKTLRRQVRTTVNKTAGVHIHAAAVNVVNGQATRMSRITIKRAISLYCLLEKELFCLVAPWRGQFEGEHSSWCQRVMSVSTFYRKAGEMLKQDKTPVVYQSVAEGNGSDTPPETEGSEWVDVPEDSLEDAESSEDEDVVVVPNSDDPFEEKFDRNEEYEFHIPPWMSGREKHVLKQIWSARTRRALRDGLLQCTTAGSVDSCRNALHLSRHGSTDGEGEVGWTLEFRMLQGTLDPELVGRWAEVVDALMRIATWAPADFKEYIESNFVNLKYDRPITTRRMKGLWLLEKLGLGEEAMKFWEKQMDQDEDVEEDESAPFLPPIDTEPSKSISEMSEITFSEGELVSVTEERKRESRDSEVWDLDSVREGSSQDEEPQSGYES